MDSMNKFTRYWTRVRGRTFRLFDVVPEGSLDWSPGAGAMTVGDVFRHLALTERWLFVEVASGGVSRYRTHGPELARSRDEIKELMTDLHAASVAILQRFDEHDWRRGIVTPAGATMPAWKWLRAMVEHEAHHRGQLYLMLRLAGVPTPPVFGMTAEQVMAAPPPL
jgi:uncharacterized damage-inducible protein DinB